MKVKSFFFLLIAFQCISSISQNLVPNPSFEEYTDCPSNQGQIELCTGWSSAGVSPDYYHPCSTTENFSVPNHWSGFQQPHSGEAYSGILTYYLKANVREYIQTELPEPLIIGTQYCLSFWVNRGLDGEIGEIYNCSTSAPGANLRTTFTPLTDPIVPDNNPLLFNPEIISDTASWTNLEFQFTADSAYQYLIIGNFFDDANTLYENETMNQCEAYYFIDDVYLAPLDSNDIVLSNHRVDLKCFPVPASNELKLKFPPELEGSEISLINPLGSEVIRMPINKSLDISSLSPGYYHLILIKEKIIFAKSLIVQ